ncbi:polysaccharide deacetylase family protein [Bacillaceae bacterium IKA-2]|nr:polysaccharide deacetylase family protein [Bacillaceae bacterium IKA-2]
MIRKLTLIATISLFLVIGYLFFPFNTSSSVKLGNDHSYFNRSDKEIVNIQPPLFIQPLENLAEKIIAVKQKNYSEPRQWGENVTNVIRNFNTDKKVVALTFDACGGEFGSGYDEKLINFLITEKIPATLFVNSRWIDTNLETFLYLASLKQFQIENHGTEHRPLSIKGGTAWGIKGTTSVDEVIAEVVTNYEKIKNLTGHESRYFRSGTAFYDEVAVQIVEDLGMKVVNYDILGDAGATFTANQVKEALLKAQPGSIALLHMNQPSKGTAAGVQMAIPLLKELGFSFITLDEGERLDESLQ